MTPAEIRLWTGNERREYLKHYILCAVRDSEISWKDFKSPDFIDKLLKVLAKDGKLVVQDLGKHGAAGVMRMGMALLANFAEGVVASGAKK